jgi:cytochrome o ubiquinol oxidase subunit 2
MKKKYKIALFLLLFLAVTALSLLFVYNNSIAVLDPKGLIAHKERHLIIISTLLMLTVVIPVFVLAFVVAWKYRATNTKAKYDPDWDYNLIAESLWWGIPSIIIIVLSIIIWESSHDLDPFKPLDSSAKTMTIQVIALQWKWLFIYPEQNIATVNFVQFPQETPINFEITADAPMNSFWIPQLGGQIYAMPGMKTQLHLIANEVGNFRGSSANLSGKGFAGMQFMAKASSLADFHQWVDSLKQTASPLTLDAYNKLAKPSENNPVASYLLKEKDLFDQIVLKFMMPMSKTERGKT